MESEFDRYNNKRRGIRSSELEEQLKKDIKAEEESIEDYNKTLELVEDENTRKQLEKIRDEEIAHKKYLEQALENPNAKYDDPS